jgi:hypothetical protein
MLTQRGNILLVCGARQRSMRRQIVVGHTKRLMNGDDLHKPFRLTDRFLTMSAFRSVEENGNVTR